MTKVKDYTIKDCEGKRVVNPSIDDQYHNHHHIDDLVLELCSELGFIKFTNKHGWFHSKDKELRIRFTEAKDAVLVCHFYVCHKVEFSHFQRTVGDTKFIWVMGFVDLVLSSIRNFYK